MRSLSERYHRIGHPGYPGRDRDRQAEQVDIVQRLLDRGVSLADIGASIGRDRFYVARLMEVNGLTRRTAPEPEAPPVRKVDTRPVLILIEPVRWPTGNGIKGSGGFDIEDTGEL